MLKYWGEGWIFLANQPFLLALQDGCPKEQFGHDYHTTAEVWFVIVILWESILQIASFSLKVFYNENFTAKIIHMLVAIDATLNLVFPLVNLIRRR